RSRHPLAVVFDDDELLAAELHGDGDAARAGVEGVLDKLLDDRGRALDDLAGRNLVRQLRRQAPDARHSHRSRLNTRSIAAARTPIRPITHQICASGPPGRTGSATFMPQMPVSTVSGMKMVEMIVRIFIT